MALASASAEAAAKAAEEKAATLDAAHWNLCVRVGQFPPLYRWAVCSRLRGAAPRTSSCRCRSGILRRFACFSFPLREYGLLQPARPAILAPGAISGPFPKSELGLRLLHEAPFSGRASRTRRGIVSDSEGCKSHVSTKAPAAANFVAVIACRSPTISTLGTSCPSS